AGAEVREHDPLAARRGEQHLLDEIADVPLVDGLAGAPAMIEPVGIGEIHAVLTWREPAAARPPASWACRWARRPTFRSGSRPAGPSPARAPLRRSIGR